MHFNQAKSRRWALVLGSSLLALSAAGGAKAASLSDITISGFVRQEFAGRVSGVANPNNTQSNVFNNIPVADYSAPGTVHTRTVRSRNNDLNYFVTRAEANVDWRLSSEWKFHGNIRAIYDWDFYEDSGDYATNPNYPSTPTRINYFQTQLHGGGRGSLLEYSNRKYSIDAPAVYLDYNHGGLFVRVGNQTIAWGESLFFRVLDVPNGLDLRRHLILDPAAEEFSDKRVPSPGVRVSYQVTNDWEVEGFAQKFTPTILNNPSTPYNLIPDQFTVLDRYKSTVDDQWNFGGRIRGQLGPLGLQFIGVSRHNPDGVFRWTYATGTGALPGTAFSFDDNGVYSYKEWFHYAGMVRLNGVESVNTALLFPGAGGGALHANNYGEAAAILDSFYDLSSTLNTGLRGFIERWYPYENVFGAGANYVVETDDPSSFWDQLITRAELSFTPNKAFTNPSLGVDPVREDEWALALVAEKYWRFTPEFPATYFVLQYLHKSASDIFGRSLQCQGGDDNNACTGQDGGYNAIAFAFQQPSPTLAWRFDFSVLADLRGSFFVQPGVKWKPNDAWQVDLYANLYTGESGNDSALSTLDWADEFFLRVSRQF